MNEIPICPKCGSRMELRETQKYTYSDGTFRKFWGCCRWPKCNGTHGATPEGTPLGTPADDITKRWRIEAHKALERYMRLPGGHRMHRSVAYKDLSKKTGIEPRKCHIGMMDIEQCKLIIEALGYALPKIEVEKEKPAEEVDQRAEALATEMSSFVE